MATYSCPVIKHQFFDSNGNPANGYKLYTYAGGTVDTPKATYQDSAGTTPNTNPIILNSRGETSAGIYLDTGTYKFVLKTDQDVEVWPQDLILGVNDVTLSQSQWDATGDTPTYVNATTFTVPGDKTTTYQVGRALKCSTSGGTRIGRISASAYTTLTTITVVLDTGSLDSGINTLYVGLISSDSSALPSTINRATTFAAAITHSASTTFNGAVNGLGRNSIINGGCVVKQNADYTLVKDTWGEGGPDMFAGMATGTAVTAGTFTQTTSANCGVTGYAAKFSGVTLTGTGVVYLRHRMISVDSKKHKNQTASFSCKVYHDVGSAINFTVTINKADVANDWTAVTEISAATATSVSSATETTVSFENVSMGDCSNGIEILITMEPGAITTKNFEITELQLVNNAAAQPFQYEDEEETIPKCMAHVQYFGKAANAVYHRGSGAGGTIGTSWITPKMWKDPTTTKVGTWTVANCNQPQIVADSDSSFAMAAQGASGDAFFATADATTYVKRDASVQL